MQKKWNKINERHIHTALKPNILRNHKRSHIIFVHFISAANFCFAILLFHHLLWLRSICMKKMKFYALACWKGTKCAKEYKIECVMFFGIFAFSIFVVLAINIRVFFLFHFRTFQLVYEPRDRRMKNEIGNLDLVIALRGFICRGSRHLNKWVSKRKMSKQQN